MFKSSFVFLFGEILSKLMPFLLMPYLTRALGVDGFGELANSLAYIAILLVFINCSQDGALARYYYFYGKRSIYTLLAVGYCYSLIISIFILLVGLWLKDLYIVYGAAIALSQSVMAVQLALQQCQKKAISYVTIQFSQSFISVGLTLLLFSYYASGYEERLFSILIANILSALIGVWITRSSTTVKLKISKKQFILFGKYIFGFGSPLIIHSLASAAKGQFDKVYIAQAFNYEILGVYSAGLQIAMAVSVVLFAINKALVPYFFEALKANKISMANINQWLFFYLLLCPLPAIFGYLLPDVAYNFVLGEGFVGVKYYTVVFLFGFSLMGAYLIMINVLFYYNKNKVIALSTLLSSIVYILLMYLFSLVDVSYIPFSLIVSNIVMVAFLYGYIYKNKLLFFTKQSLSSPDSLKQEK
ncbi:oligosaccharide flippase family protein [Psychromonas hadalis]|uniref:oligosaccharide flippase family protein n=1 Tax=Psychromonas hadalis TaxID=211669 RepID=UPI0003B31CFA|nr:oligosaccharide flippase family protein [Psychromonas hadalis]